MSGLSRRLGVTVLVGAWAAAGSACVPGDEAEAPGPEVSALPAAGRFPAPKRASVFYIGYDDRDQQTEQIERDTNGDGIDDRFFFTTDVKRTNRAVFTKLQYLFRY